MTIKFLDGVSFDFHKSKDDNVIGRAHFSFSDGTKSTEIFKVIPITLDEQSCVEQARLDEELSIQGKLITDSVIKTIEEEKKKKEDHKKAVQKGIEKQKERLKKQKEKELSKESDNLGKL